MITFSDLVMLLLTFFVMLLTMKSMDIGRARAVFATTEGPLDYYVQKNDRKQEVDFDPSTSSVIMTVTALEETMGLMKLRTSSGAEADKVGISLREVIEISENEKGISLSLKADELFDSGEAEIRIDRLYLLDDISHLLRFAANDILILGHTDNMPVRGDRFTSNLELSSYRALNVLYYLTDSRELKPERLASGGCGDALPRYPNDTPENQSKNRRVELLILKLF